MPRKRALNWKRLCAEKETDILMLRVQIATLQLKLETHV